jgi:uroporphyrinogen-III synthase
MNLTCKRILMTRPRAQAEEFAKVYREICLKRGIV